MCIWVSMQRSVPSRLTVTEILGRGFGLHHQEKQSVSVRIVVILNFLPGQGMLSAPKNHLVCNIYWRCWTDLIIKWFFYILLSHFFLDANVHTCIESPHQWWFSNSMDCWHLQTTPGWARSTMWEKTGQQEIRPTAPQRLAHWGLP